MPSADTDTVAPASNTAADVAVEPPAETRPRWDRTDTALALIAAASTVFVHPVHAILSQQYWLDEAWVAVSLRVPWTRVHAIALVTPLGFDALLRLVPGSGMQRARLVVLMFAVLAVVMAYVFTRLLAWSSPARARFAAVAAAIVAMLAPLALVRNDLKQYTCDAFCALVVLTITAAVDRSPGRPVWWLAVTGLVVLPFSSASAFVTVAAFAGLLGSALIARQARRVIEVLVFGGIAGVGVAAYYATLVIPQTYDALHEYWSAWYLTGGPAEMARTGWARWIALNHWFAMPAWLLTALAVAGLVTLARLRAYAVVIAFVLLWIEVAVVARAELYPFLDRRTSHFLLVPTLVIAAIGFAALVQLVYRWWRPAAVVVTIVAGIAFFAGTRDHIDKLGIPDEVAREQAEYVAANARPNDVVVVNRLGSYAFSYYWPAGLTTHLKPAGSFNAEAKDLNAVYTVGRTQAEIFDAVREAVERWRAQPRGSRLFIVRSHVSDTEANVWQLAFARLGLHPPKELPNAATPLVFERS
jgi:hypothetical protein